MPGKTISTYSLKDITDQEISIDKFSGQKNIDDLSKKEAHRRGDNYLFIFQKKGRSKIIVDFNEIELTGGMILCILPGQIHYGVSAARNTDAWLITLDAHFVNEDQQAILEDYYFHYQPLILLDLEQVSLNECIELILSLKANRQHLNFLPQVAHSLINACVGMFVSAYYQIEHKHETVSRGDILTRQFKRLLLRLFRTHKSTSDYASLLNVTPAHLNEAIKLTTGFTVSYWIQQAIMTEAKRLLYVTDATIKEIAFQLGFTDHAYFTRYFSNAEGDAPLRFRLKFRK